MSVVLIDATSDSLTVSWPPVTDATRYALEYRVNDGDGEAFELLSDKLTQHQARKHNLTNPKGYFFRVGAILGDDGAGTVKSWISHSEPFKLLPSDNGQAILAAPIVSTYSGSPYALLIQWKKVPNAAGYELQMRENQGGVPWTTIASALTGTEVRKKNLTSPLGYQFRVAPNTNAVTKIFSPPSNVVVAKGLSQAMKRWFGSLANGKLLKNNGTSQPPLSVPLEDALGGKEFVLLYASAHWCPPCRNFTPMLAQWYKSSAAVRQIVEVIFLSCDHDEQGFLSYFKHSHPWLAVDFDDDAREQLLATIKVSGIPRLVVLDADTGKIVEDNVVGKTFDLNRWRTMAKAQKQS